MEHERWAYIPGYDDSYQVSDRGRVWSHRPLGRSLIRDQVGREVLGCIERRSGYRVVSLVRPGGRQIHERVHVLVAATFLGPRPAGLLVLHENDSPADNRVENLRYGTFAHNAEDKVRNGKHHQALKTHCPRRHRLVEPNLEKTQLRRGRRSCRACAQASSSGLRRVSRGLPAQDRDAEADRLYARIMDPR